MNIRTRIFALAVVSASFIPLGAHAALRTWSGGGTNANWTTAANWGGTAPVAGDDLLFPPAAAQPNNTNNFPSGTTFNSLIFSGASYSLNGNSIALNAGILATNGANNFVNNSLILNSNQTFTINVGSQSFTLLNAIDLNGKDLTFNIGSASLAQVQAVISGSGGLIKTGPGSALLYASNTFSGSVQLLQGFITAYHGHALGDTNGNTTVSSGTTLTFANPIIVSEPLVLAGTLNSAGGGTKTFNGAVLLTDPNATIHVVNGAPLTINGVISGTGGFTKDLGDTLTLNANNTYTGTTTVSAGALQVNGSQPASPILLNQGTLTGTGTVGPVTCGNLFASTVSPGSGGLGILNCSNLSLTSRATFSIGLTGPAPGGGYGQLNVSGTVTLNSAFLDCSVGFTPPVGETFIIINNDSADPVNGTFSGMPEGALLNLGGYPFHISYVGGTGNDVVLTRISPPTYLTSITRLTNGTVTLAATGALANFSYTILAATNLSSGVVWSNLGAVVASSGGFLGFIDDGARFFPSRFYRVVSP